MTPSKASLVTGILLIVVALIGYLGSGLQSWTALIPSFIGVPILLCGLVARRPAKLKLAMHLAAVFGLLGFIAPLGRLIPMFTKGEFELSLVTASLLAMAVICGAFLVYCIKSFRAARMARNSG